MGITLQGQIQIICKHMHVYLLQMSALQCCFDFVVTAAEVDSCIVPYVRFPSLRHDPSHALHHTDVVTGTILFPP